MLVGVPQKRRFTFAWTGLSQALLTGRMLRQAPQPAALAEDFEWTCDDGEDRQVLAVVQA